MQCRVICAQRTMPLYANHFPIHSRPSYVFCVCRQSTFRCFRMMKKKKRTAPFSFLTDWVCLNERRRVCVCVSVAWNSHDTQHRKRKKKHHSEIYAFYFINFCITICKYWMQFRYCKCRCRPYIDCIQYWMCCSSDAQEWNWAIESSTMVGCLYCTIHFSFLCEFCAFSSLLWNHVYTEAMRCSDGLQHKIVQYVKAKAQWGFVSSFIVVSLGSSSKRESTMCSNRIRKQLSKMGKKICRKLRLWLAWALSD